MHRTQPAAFDFVALYAGARLVATGQGHLVTDGDALLAMERAAQPDRTVLLNNPNVPALSGVLAPLGALPYDAAFVVMLTISTAALAAAAVLLGPLARADQRGRLLIFALLAPPSLIALLQGQTTALVLLGVAASLRTTGLVSGLLLGAVAFRPQLLPLLALAVLRDRSKALGLLLACAGVALLSLLVAGPEGLARYPARLADVAAEVGRNEISVPALARRLGVDAWTALGVAAVLTAAALPVVMRARSAVPAGAVAALLAAPHALLHDVVFAYPAAALSAVSSRLAWSWGLAATAGTIAQLLGVPALQVALAVLLVTVVRRRPPAS
ncbi:MAG TPA: glycosyltransferase 87 family protein [Candidatus Limnocylindria bacterium]|nr:glycosyltransferase 87 family protein [Candidatus Limnocylindria bacterium]